MTAEVCRGEGAPLPVAGQKKREDSMTFGSRSRSRLTRGRAGHKTPMLFGGR